ncbi:helix-turn-helix transcriptional regulator [Escherichia coli]|uniref:helix-turn-helix transcriptional regulator n=1 Tax=Escherichia coli TaxID=562 RepID=UPI00207CFCC7|nr:transcriptional regulator [Escherichia coli]MCT9907673.1 transcriptional regulator [Escherichia coli]MDC6206742.1 transcriptional regulator [Escherichia coli]
MEQENTFSSNIRFFHEPQRLIRINHMIELLAVSRTTLWRWVNEGVFLSPVKFKGEHSAGLPASMRSG